MGFTFSHTPQLFGMVHILSLLVIAAWNCVFFKWAKGQNEDRLLLLLKRIGTGMIIGEFLKQIFCFFYVFDRQINLWFFPWQLCSMTMYCSFCASFLNENRQNAVLVFLSSFSLFAAIVALLLPYDMLRDQVLLTLYSFVYHGLMITVSIASLDILRKRKEAEFLPAVFLFLIMAVIAEMINVISHFIFHDIHVEPNMFYITPYYPTTQPVFHEIAVRYGIFAEVVVYLGSIILVSLFIWLIEKKTLLSDRHDQ